MLVGRYTKMSESEKLLDAVLAAMVHERFQSAREISMKVDGYAHVTVRHACNVLLLEHKCEGRQAALPGGGFRWEYRRLS